MTLLLALLLGCGSPPDGEAIGAVAPSEPVAAPATAPVAAPVVTWALPTRHARSPGAVAATDDVRAARAALERVVRERALDPGNPWALGHGLIALGPDVLAANGEPAVDWLFAEYAEPVQVGGERLVRFPTSRGDIRIEPHTDLLLKALTEVGVRPERQVTVAGAPAVVGDLYRHSLWRAWVQGDEVSAGSWNDTPWTLQGLATWAPDDLAWTAHGDHQVTLDALTSGVVGKLHHENAFLRQAMASGDTVQKRGQHIWQYTCGGAHLLQGGAYAVARGFGTDDDRARVEAQVPVLFYRLDLELTQVDAALRQRPDYAVILLEQRLKFLGHFLESAHKLAALGFYTPSEAQQERLAFALAQLVATVDVLGRMGVLDKLDAVRDAGEQVYLDYVGDAAHALVGLDLATGEGTVGL